MRRILSTPDFPVNLTEHKPSTSFGVCPTDTALILQGVSEKISNLPTVNQIVGRKTQIGTQRSVGELSVTQVSPLLLPATQMASLSPCLLSPSRPLSALFQFLSRGFFHD